MEKSEIETVLANWIGQALSPIGQLPPGSDPAAWIASRFAEWWTERAEVAFADAEKAASGIKGELTRLGGWESCGEVLHEQIHLQDALADLRKVLGLPAD